MTIRGAPAIERDLRSRYADRYRVMRANSGNAAWTTLRELKARNNPSLCSWRINACPKWMACNFLSKATEMHPLREARPPHRLCGHQCGH